MSLNNVYLTFLFVFRTLVYNEFLDFDLPVYMILIQLMRGYSKHVYSISKLQYLLLVFLFILRQSINKDQIFCHQVLLHSFQGSLVEKLFIVKMKRCLNGYPSGASSPCFQFSVELLLFICSYYSSCFMFFVSFLYSLFSNYSDIIFFFITIGILFILIFIFREY